MAQDEFQEIAHSGGQVIIRTGTDQQGRRSHQLEWRHQRPVAAAIFAVYALPEGLVVGQMGLGGIGHVPNPPPVRGCFQVIIGSDSHGKFGHQCPLCSGYWRADFGTQFCPYCGIRSEPYNFLTNAQKAYVQEVCARMRVAIAADQDGEHLIDMDAVADAVGSKEKKPPFYYAEQAQQNQFTCEMCGAFNDILGKFGYCCSCGTRNDLRELRETIQHIRDRINSGGPYEACVRDAVSAFDSFVGPYVAQLLQHVPMTPKRRGRFDGRRFHDLRSVAADLKEAFDIDVLAGLSPEEFDFAVLMFHRRHVYEHKGGEADEKYIQDSGDTHVKPKQALHETVESAHRIAGIVSKMAANLDHGFHEILQPDHTRIERYQRWRTPGK